MVPVMLRRPIMAKECYRVDRDRGWIAWKTLLYIFPKVKRKVKGKYPLLITTIFIPNHVNNIS